MSIKVQDHSNRMYYLVDRGQCVIQAGDGSNTTNIYFPQNNAAVPQMIVVQDTIDNIMAALNAAP